MLCWMPYRMMPPRALRSMHTSTMDYLLLDWISWSLSSRVDVVMSYPWMKYGRQHSYFSLILTIYENSRGRDLMLLLLIRRWAMASLCNADIFPLYSTCLQYALSNSELCLYLTYIFVSRIDTCPLRLGNNSRFFFLYSLLQHANTNSCTLAVSWSWSRGSMSLMTAVPYSSTNLMSRDMLCWTLQCWSIPMNEYTFYSETERHDSGRIIRN